MISATTKDLDVRLEALTAARPDLALAAALQRALLGRIIASTDRLEAEPTTTRTLVPPSTAISRLKQGLPVLRGDTVQMPVLLLAPELAPLCATLAEGGAGDPARHIADALHEGRIDRGSLLAASFRRDQSAIRTFARHASLSPDLLWLVGELAAGPFAFSAQTRVFADDEARAARDAWDRGYCPACGSWPAIAELAGGARRLRCSFCAAAWQPSVCRCVYCAEEGPAFSLAAPDEERPAWRLELCAACGGYLKSIEAAAPIRYPLLAVDDMETTPLDIVAMDRGYGRPPLPDFGASLSMPKAEGRIPNA
ncbi:MAG: formate dehydrogenase accessory protein FdhE [Vicinamibacterales bacterium]